MPIYEYVGISLAGKVLGSVPADNIASAKQILSIKGIKITRIKKQAPVSEKIFWRVIGLLQISLEQKLSLVDSLQIASFQSNKKIVVVCEKLLTGLKEGNEFHTLLAAVFPDVDKSMLGVLRIGSQKNGLHNAIKVLIAQKEARDHLKNETQKALAYPIFVTFFALLALIVVFDTVLPEFQTMIDPSISSPLQKFIFAGAGKGYQTFLIAFWSVIIGLILFAFGKRSHSIERGIYGFLETMPFVKRSVRNITASQFMNAVSLALNLKCELSEAVRLASSSIKNPIHKQRLSQVTERLKQGVTFSTSLRETDIFADMDLATIEIAERSQGLEVTMRILADESSKKKLQRVALITQIISPMAILLLGVIIFLVAFVIITPMMSLQNSIG